MVLLGLTPPQFNTLRALHVSGGSITITQFAHALAYVTQSMTTMLDRMEQREWVRRLRDLPDRCSIRVEFTTAGQAKLAEALAVEAVIITQAFGRLTPA